MIDINRHTLSNGLRIVHSCNPDTKTVTVNVLYGVGGKNDHQSQTGYAHLLEHLMFEGSKNAPNFDNEIQIAGGENNAYTTLDITNYYETLLYQNVETAFWLESDRMVNLNLTEESLNVQRNVVAEEFKQRVLNKDYGDSSAIYRKLAYKKHPYRITTIGEKLSHIYDAQLSDVISFYKRYYAPNNAVLSVVGNISFSECVRLVEKWFGNIPPQQIESVKLPVEPQQRKARFKKIQKNVPINNIYKAYHMTSRLDKDYPCFDLITDILASGKSSRLKRELVQNKKMFSLIDSAITGDVEPGLLIVVGRVNPGVKVEDADDALSQEIARLGEELIPNRELEKVLNKFESNFLFENTEAGELAANLAFYEMLGDANLINREVERYRMVTPERVRDVAKRFLVPKNCSTLYYLSSAK